MFDSRRGFLTLIAGAGTFAIFNAAQLAGQSGQARPKETSPQEPKPAIDDSDASPLKSPTKALLEANEKDIKKNIEKLFQLATDLKTEVEKTDSSQILSLALVKKAEEIEKLAHDIKTRAKG